MLADLGGASVVGSRLNLPGNLRSLAPVMEKPGLGRGLGSLMGAGSPFGRSPTKQQAEGVQLLLRGDDGKELVVPTKPAAGEGPSAPRWVLAGAVVMDLALMAVALWAELATRGWMRHVAALVLVLAGAWALGVAAWLRGRPANRELASLNPLSEETPRLRVRFMDEVPRRR